MSSGALGYITKPFNKLGVISKVKELLNGNNVDSVITN